MLQYRDAFFFFNYIYFVVFLLIKFAILLKWSFGVYSFKTANAFIHLNSLSFYILSCLPALESVVCLVERDCDTTIGDTNTFLAGHLAARYDKVDCLKYLVKQGTAIDVPQGEGKASSHIVRLLLYFFLFNLTIL